MNRSIKFIKSTDGTVPPSSFSGMTLLSSIPSVGNVGQLAADFLITNIPNTIRIGYLYSPFILPLVGNDPYSSSSEGHVHLAAEVYYLSNHNSILVHIRAPIIKQEQFSAQFVSWVRDNQFSKWFILASANASWRMDSLLLQETSRSGPMITMRCKIVEAAKNDKYNGDVWNGEQEQELFKYIPEMKSSNGGNVNSEEEDKFMSGLRRELLKAIEKQQQQEQESPVNACFLLVLCNEGDNLPHGIALGQTIASHYLLLSQEQEAQQQQQKWILPASWQFLYGSPAASSLY